MGDGDDDLGGSLRSASTTRVPAECNSNCYPKFKQGGWQPHFEASSPGVEQDMAVGDEDLGGPLNMCKFYQKYYQKY